MDPLHFKPTIIIKNVCVLMKHVMKCCVVIFLLVVFADVVVIVNSLGGDLGDVFQECC